jgi:hypothetical protein
LYKGIELEGDTSLLYYASQIELQTSSEREWQIVQCLVHIDHLPLPYFVVFKRFYNYIKATTDWNLAPLFDKLRNTEYYYNAMRQEDSALRVRPYRNLRCFEDFAGVGFNDRGAPIDNLELAHFGFPKHKVSLDIVGQRELIPGTADFKETYNNKVRSLKNLGWKHLTISEAELGQHSLAAGIRSIQTAYQPHVEEQQAIIDYEDYQTAQKIQKHKVIEEMKEWDLEDINRFIAEAKGEEYLELGDEVVDEMAELEESREKSEAQENKRKNKK